MRIRARWSAGSAESNKATDRFRVETENCDKAYGCIIARYFDADYALTAHSGQGMVRDWGDPKQFSDVNMSTRYTHVFDDHGNKEYTFTHYRPQLVLINLGTNDMSTNNYDVKLLRAAYVKFIQQVRSLNPKAKIVMLTGSMLNGKELELVRQTLDSVVSDYNKNGDRDIYRFDMTPHTGDLHYGADWHPSYWQHEKMANELTSYLRTLMGWY